MKFHWFGDSWVAGDELAQPEQHRFAKLVSDHFAAECVDLSQKGSNINALPLLFQRHLPCINSEDTVFFCLTASNRTGMFDESGQFKNILTQPYPAHRPHAHGDKWFKYFDNPNQRVYNYDCMVNLLWLWCQHSDIKCYFLNLFTTEPRSIIDSVDPAAWLVPRDQCIAQCILSCIDNQFGAVIANDCAELTESQWQQQETLVAKYIRPNYAHPNVAGHAAIAQHLIELLNDRS